MTKLAINQALDAQGFTAHIMSAHSTYINRRIGSHGPGLRAAPIRGIPARSACRWCRWRMERYQRDQERNKKR